MRPCVYGLPQGTNPVFYRGDEPRRQALFMREPTRKPAPFGCPPALLPPEAPLRGRRDGSAERSSKSTGAALGAAALPINRAWCTRGEQLGCPAHAYGTTLVVGTEAPSRAAPGAREGLPLAR